eukprot:TRINITY_DN59739_c0_g1_i4.p1 TRINITY_DN59739_c0_g1~~TRINITY_DN59739_c0_g1_i4.p1  ORF type:complete len:316 (-),score=79.57 TRINITY_DN59739_c0_g1_i4:1056-2003(-)
MQSPTVLTVNDLPPEVMRRIMVWLGCTSCETIMCLQLVCRNWLHAADGEMWRELLLALCGRDIVEMIAKLNSIRTSTKTYHKDVCLNLAYFGDEAIVVDIGRGYTKYGKAGLESIFDPEPRILQICQPNADCDLQDMLYAVEDNLECDLSKTTVVLTVPLSLSGADHCTIISALTNSVPQLKHCRAAYFVESAPCVLLAHGLITGVVCSIGFGQTFVIPVVEGQVMTEGIVTSHLGGMALTQHMQQLVFWEMEQQPGEHDWDLIQDALDMPFVTYCRNLKEQHCYVLPHPPRLATHSIEVLEGSGSARVRVRTKG